MEATETEFGSTGILFTFFFPSDVRRLDIIQISVLFTKKKNQE
jgi:hypothetical protein